MQIHVKRPKPKEREEFVNGQKVTVHVFEAIPTEIKTWMVTRDDSRAPGQQFIRQQRGRF